MYKNPWFTLLIGLTVGLAVGYLLAERQPVPPARAAAAGAAQAVPPGHPAVEAEGVDIARQQRLQQQAAELEGLLAQSPGDQRLMVALGNLYYDAAEWQSAKTWYQKALAIDDSDPDVLTDLGVVLRNLGEFEASLSALDRALAVAPGQWQARYNRVVVLHFDLHRHDEAVAELARLQELAAGNPEVPDLTPLAREVAGGGAD